jgi:hypothetical protein
MAWVFMVDPDVMEEKRTELADSLFGDTTSSYHLNREEADNEARRRSYNMSLGKFHLLLYSSPESGRLRISVPTRLMRKREKFSSRKKHGRCTKWFANYSHGICY